MQGRVWPQRQEGGRIRRTVGALGGARVGVDGQPSHDSPLLHVGNAHVGPRPPGDWWKVVDSALR